MKKFSIHLFLTLLFSNFSNLAQEEYAVPYLRMTLSPSQSAMALTGASLPTDDPYGFLYNPAQLGFTSKTNNLTFVFYPSKISWINKGLFNADGTALNLGHNFKNTIGIPLSAGFGFSRRKVDYNLEDFHLYDKFDSYSIGAGFDYYINFYAGITFKSITSEIGYVTGEGPYSFKWKGNAIDYGFMLNVPVLKLIDSKFSLNLIKYMSDKPYLNISLGMSTSNIGDNVYYIDKNSSISLPRIVRSGYGISTGLDLFFNSGPLNVIDIAFTVDAEDFLVKEYDWWSEPVEYQNGFGDIDFGKNILQVKGDDKVISRAGFQISLIETLVLRRGHFSSTAYRGKTNGFELRSKGLFKLLSAYSGNEVINYIAEHFDLRYYSAYYFAVEETETSIDGLAIVFSGLSL